MKSEFYKTVLMPIEVALGDYCWGPGKKQSHVCCGHFDNEGGDPRCTLSLGYLNYTNLGNVKKPEKCLNLKEV